MKQYPFKGCSCIIPKPMHRVLEKWCLRNPETGEELPIESEATVCVYCGSPKSEGDMCCSEIHDPETILVLENGDSDQDYPNWEVIEEYRDITETEEYRQAMEKSRLHLKTHYLDIYDPTTYVLVEELNCWKMSERRDEKE